MCKFIAWAALAASVGCAWAAEGQAGTATRGDASGRLNILLITADDMNYDSVGVAGCRVPEVTPNIDRLAADGVRFIQAHVTIAVCQPCRSVLMTGRYPHRNGAMGFEPIDVKVPTLQEHLREAGYLNGILGKVSHLEPVEKFCWDFVVKQDELGQGRSPAEYGRHARAFFERAKAEQKPFFLMANSLDPHRPFAGSEQERNYAERRNVAFPGVSRSYRTDEVEVPPFLPDLPDVRREVAQYFASVHRCDETVGAVLTALADAGLAEHTLVMFLSDNGMAFPFAKTNCYLASTRTPWIVRWPNVTEGGRVDDRHFISGIDFMPTVLEAAGVPAPAGMDGRSFAPLLAGRTQHEREDVFTVFHETSAKRAYPMRCVQNRRFGYIYNAWSDGQTVFHNESQSGLTFRAMQAAAENDPAVAARVRLFQYRVPEELYDIEKDPHALRNLADDPAHRDVLARMRERMDEVMANCDDPLLPVFRKDVLASSWQEAR